MNLTTMDSLISPKFSMPIKHSVFRKDTLWDKYFGESHHVSILLKLQHYKPLANIVDGTISGAATVSEAYDLKDVLQDGNPSEDSSKLINTGTIDPFVSLWGRSNTQYIKGRYQTPFIDHEDLQGINQNRLKQATSPKVIVAGMSKNIEAFPDIRGEYLAAKSTSIIIDSSKEKLLAICAILNSNLISYWLQKNFHSLKMAGGYINVGVSELEIVPVSDSFDENLSKLAELSQRAVCELAKDGSSRAACDKINELVYNLYGLTPDEITIVERAVQ